MQTMCAVALDLHGVGVPVASDVVLSDVVVCGLVGCNSHTISIRHDR